MNMRKIKLEDFNDLEVTKAFDNGLDIPEINKYLMYQGGRLFYLNGDDEVYDMTLEFHNFRKEVQSSSELDNILYLSSLDARKFNSNLLNLEGFSDKPRAGIPFPSDSQSRFIGIVYTEFGLSILYVITRKNLSFLIVDELANDRRKNIIYKKKVDDIPVDTTSDFVVYGMYSPIVGFYSVDMDADFGHGHPFDITSLFQMKSMYSMSPELVKAKFYISSQINKKLAKEESLYCEGVRLDYRTLDPRATLTRQLLFEREYHRWCHQKARYILWEIVFNPDTETVVFTESMADQYSKRHGIEKDESLIGITRIKDQTWMKEIIVDHPFGVCGHYRRLHNPNTVGKDYDGTPIQGRTWIKEFTKKGYHRKPQRDIEFEREDN